MKGSEGRWQEEGVVRKVVKYNCELWVVRREVLVGLKEGCCRGCRNDL